MFTSHEMGQFAATEGVHVWYEPVPAKYIHIEENPIARDVTPRSFHKFLDRDEIYKMVCMSVSDGFGVHNVMMAKSSCRSVPLYLGEFPIYRMDGGVLKAKGSGFSGLRRKLIPYTVQTGDDKDPQGLFGTKDATWEVEVSNDLLLNDVRTAFPYVNITLDNQVRSWVLERTVGFQMRQVIDDAFSIVQANGDSLAYLLSIGDTQERQDVTDHAMFTPNRLREDIMRGAALMRNELRMNHSLMQKYADIMGVQSELATMLDCMSSGVLLDARQFALYRSLLVTIYAVNSYGLQGVIDDRLAAGKEFNIIPKKIGMPHDVGCAHFMTDYELARHEMSFPVDDFDELVPSYVSMYLLNIIALSKYHPPVRISKMEMNPLSLVRAQDWLEAFSLCKVDDIREEFARQLPKAYHHIGK